MMLFCVHKFFFGNFLQIVWNFLKLLWNTFLFSEIYSSSFRMCLLVDKGCLEPLAEHPTEYCTSVRASPMADVERDDTTSNGTVTTWGGVMAMPVCTIEVSARVCKMCGESTFDPAPFSDALSEDTFGGLWPWMRYIRSKTFPDREEPVARTCLICWTLFSKSSMGLKYGKSICTWLS